MENFLGTDPAEPEAKMVTNRKVPIDVVVPEMIPVLALIDNPEGKLVAVQVQGLPQLGALICSL